MTYKIVIIDPPVFLFFDRGVIEQDNKYRDNDNGKDIQAQYDSICK
jgi:hypothetical protein